MSMGAVTMAPPSHSATRLVRIPAYGASIAAELTIPDDARGLVVFSRIGGGRRRTLRDRREAVTIKDGGYGTLVFDLLTPDEEMADGDTRLLHFDVHFLAKRLLDVVDWVADQDAAADLPLTLFGADTGAAAALIVAAMRARVVQAVVSSAGRPDLASLALERVQAPTLLIVGSRDTDAIPRNRCALERLTAPKGFVLLQGQTHSLEDNDSVDEVARLALGWFDRHVTHWRSEGWMS